MTEIPAEYREYHRAVMETSSYHTEPDLQRYIRRNPLAAHYGEATYTAYANKHNSEGYLGRKVYAIPRMLISGVIKTIFHLFLTIVPMRRFILEDHQNKEIQKVYSYSLGRDLEETLGHFITLFHDRLGTFLVQKSLFQKGCYYSYLSHLTSPHILDRTDNSWMGQNAIEIPQFNKANEISLGDLVEMPLERRKQAIEIFKLSEILKKFVDEQAFFALLEKVDKLILDEVTIVDLKLENPIVNFAVLTDDTFKNLTLEQLKNEKITVRIGSFIERRLAQINKGVKNDPQPLPALLKDIKLAQLHQMTGKQLSAYGDLLPDNIFLILSQQQIKDFDFDKISDQKLEKLISYVDGKIEKERFALYSVQQLQPILSRLSLWQLSLISDDQLKKLNLSSLNEQQLRAMFPYINGKEERRRFALVSPEQVATIKPKIEAYIKQYLT